MRDTVSLNGDLTNAFQLGPQPWSVLGPRTGQGLGWADHFLSSMAALAMWHLLGGWMEDLSGHGCAHR